MVFSFVVTIIDAKKASVFLGAPDISLAALGSQVANYPGSRDRILVWDLMSLRSLMSLMQHGDTGLRAPYMDRPLDPSSCFLVLVSKRVVGGLVGGDILCCHPPSEFHTGPLYEEG